MIHIQPHYTEEGSDKNRDAIALSVGDVRTSVSRQGASVNLNVFEYVRKHIQSKRGNRTKVESKHTGPYGFPNEEKVSEGARARDRRHYQEVDRIRQTLWTLYRVVVDDKTRTRIVIR